MKRTETELKQPPDVRTHCEELRYMQVLHGRKELPPFRVTPHERR